MAVLVHPQSELIREPRLLVPGMQPLGPVRVDVNNPLSNGLIYKKLFRPDHRLTVTNGAPVIKGYGQGQALYFNGSSDRAIEPAPRPSFAGMLSFAAGYIMHTEPGSGGGTLFSTGMSGSSYQGCALLFTYDNTLNKMTFFRSGNGVPGCSMVEGTTLTLGLYTKAVWVWPFADTPTSGQRYYKNGVAETPVNTYAGGNSAAYDLNGSLFFGSNNYATTYLEYTNSSLFYLFVWNRALTAGEGLSMSIDPYQFLIPA